MTRAVGRMRAERRVGVLTMILSCVLFSVMSALVRGAEGVNAYTMGLTRFAIGAATVALLFATGVDALRWHNWPWLVARGVSGGLAVVISYWAIQRLGLARAVMFTYTYVLFAAILAVPILGERVRPGHWAAIAVACAGVALLCGADRLSAGMDELVALAGGFLSGVAVVCVTRCRDTDSSGNIFWSQSVFGMAMVAWPACTHWVWPTGAQWGWLLAIGLLATAGQLSMTYAYKYTGAAHGSLLSLLTPVLSAAIGVLYFREAPGVAFYTGAALIMLSCGYLSLNPVGRGEAKQAVP